MQQMRYPCDFFQFKPTFPIMVWPRFWNDFRSRELLRSKWESAGSQRTRLWCWSLVTGNNPGRSSSDQHLDTQEQGHLGWSTMQGCWPRVPASPLGIWHDHKAHQNLDATPGNRQGGGNQNRLSESFHPLAKWRSYRRNGVLCGNLKWCFLHTEFVKWTFSPLYILYLPTEKSTCQRCGTWSTGMQPPEVMTSGKWFIVSLPQSPHLWWGLYCSLFNAEVKHCVFPSTLVFSVYLFISLTPGIKQGESSYRDLKKKQRAGGRYQPEDY